MIFFYNKIKSSKFLRSMSVMVSGSIVSQFITLISFLFLTRIYSPQQFAIYTLILTAESIFGSIMCGRFEMSIITSSDEIKVNALIKLSFLINILFSLIFGSIYGSYYFIFSTSYQSYSYSVFFIIMLLFFNGILRILEANNNKSKNYKLIANGNIMRNFSQNFLLIVFGLLGFNVFGMLLAHSIGFLFGMKYQSKDIRKEIPLILASSKKEIKLAAKEEINQIIYSTPSIFANRLSYSSIVLIIENLFGLITLGYYSFSYKVLGIPLTLFASNASRIFLKDASLEYIRYGTIRKSIIKVSSIMIFISVPMILILSYLGPSLFSFILGENWKVAGIYASILAPLFGIRLVVSSISNGFQVIKKQNVEFFLQLFFIIFSVFIYIFSLYKNFSIEQFLSYIAFSFSVVYCFYFFYLFSFSKNNKERLEKL